jgi:hypothetical protein
MPSTSRGRRDEARARGRPMMEIVVMVTFMVAAVLIVASWVMGVEG